MGMTVPPPVITSTTTSTTNSDTTTTGQTTTTTTATTTSSVDATSQQDAFSQFMARMVMLFQIYITAYFLILSNFDIIEYLLI